MKKVKTAIILMIVIIILAALGFGVWKIMQWLAPSDERVLPGEHFVVPEGEVLTIQDDMLARKNVQLREF